MASIREEPAYREQMIDYFSKDSEWRGTEGATRSYWERALNDRCRYFVVANEVVFEGDDGPFLSTPSYYEEHLRLFDGHRKATAADGLYCRCGSNTFRVFQDRDRSYQTIAQCSACGAEESVHDG